MTETAKNINTPDENKRIGLRRKPRVKRSHFVATSSAETSVCASPTSQTVPVNFPAVIKIETQEDKEAQDTENTGAENNLVAAMEEEFNSFEKGVAINEQQQQDFDDEKEDEDLKNRIFNSEDEQEKDSVELF